MHITLNDVLARKDFANPIKNRLPVVFFIWLSCIPILISSYSFSLIMGRFDLENRDIRFSLHCLLDNYPLFILIEAELNHSNVNFRVVDVPALVQFVGVIINHHNMIQSYGTMKVI